MCARVHSVAQSCLTLCDPMDCSLPGSSVLKILQARILEGVAMPFYTDSKEMAINISPNPCSEFALSVVEKGRY